MFISTLNKIEKQSVMEFRGRLLNKLGKEVISVRLFGSKARGDFRKDSDIDLLVILRNTSSKKKDIIYDIASEILLSSGIDLSVKVFDLKEFYHFKSIPTVFIQNIEREGIII